MTTFVDCIVDVLLGLAVLALANTVLDPVPLVAVTSWVIGLLLFCLTGSRSLRWASIGFLAGALLGIGNHLFVHVSGRSTLPPEGIYFHVIDDAAIGALCGALALTASVGRHWRRLTTRWSGP